MLISAYQNSMQKIVTWKCHMDKSAEGKYGMILGQDFLNEMVLDTNFSEHAIIGGTGTYEEYPAPMVDASN